jgi:hypothetical protein
MAQFTLTPLGEALKTGAPGAARSAILTLASPWITGGWERLLESVQTGRPGLEQALGMPIFDWLAQHPEEASLFSETMVSFHGAEPAAVAGAYDFSSMTTIVDVGGATGNLLSAILRKYPRLVSTLGKRSPYPFAPDVTPSPVDLKGHSREFPSSMPCSPFLVSA